MKGDFLDFLRTGRLLGLGIGSTTAEVVRVLGEPQDRSCEDVERGLEAWWYRGIVISIQDQTVASIGSALPQEWDNQDFPRVFEWDESFPGECTVSEFFDCLKAWGISSQAPSVMLERKMDAFCVTTAGVMVCARSHLVPAPEESEALYDFSADSYIVNFVAADDRWMGWMCGE